MCQCAPTREASRAGSMEQAWLEQGSISGEPSVASRAQRPLGLLSAMGVPDRASPKGTAGAEHAETAPVTGSMLQGGTRGPRAT